MEKHDVYLDDAAEDRGGFQALRQAQSEYYKRANIVQRFAMEDALYRLTMELPGKIIGPFEVSDSVHCSSVSPVALAGL